MLHILLARTGLPLNCTNEHAKEIFGQYGTASGRRLGLRSLGLLGFRVQGLGFRFRL